MSDFVKVPAAIASTALVLALAGASPTAKAEGLSAEGKFSLTYTYVNDSSKTVVIGKDRLVRVNSAIMTLVNDSGQGLLNNMGGRCNGMGIIDLVAKMFEAHGYCNYIDTDKDQVFEKFDFPNQAFAPVATATGQWLGGTGKYAGLQGDFEIKEVDFPDAGDGIMQGTGKKMGTYKIGK